MRFVWLCTIQIRPTQKAPRPIPLPRFMILTELIEVDWPIRLVQRIRPIRATIVRQPRCYRYAGPGKQQRLPILTDTLRRSREFRRDPRRRSCRRRETRGQEIDQRGNGSGRRLGAYRDDIEQG